MAKIKKYSKSYAPKVVTKLLGEYPQVNRKLFYQRAKKLGMDKIEQATYLQLLKEQNLQSIGRRKLMQDILLKGYKGFNPERISNIIDAADVYSLEWFSVTPIRGTEYFPIKKYEVERYTKEELIQNIIENTTEEGWKKRLYSYRESYLKAIEKEYLYNKEEIDRIRNKIMSMSWQEFLLFTTTRSGRISYRYEDIAIRSLNDENGEDMDGVLEELWQDITRVQEAFT